jgi:flagellar FliL protein
MAKDEKVEEVAAAPKSKKKLILIIAVVVVVLIAGGAAALLMMGGGKDKKDGHAKEENAHEQEHAKTVLVPFEEKFTVNILSDDGSSHYLQVPKLELEVANEEVAKQVEGMKSKISDRVSSVLRQKSMKEMLEPGSDIKLKEELKKVINETLEVNAGVADKKGVKEVILPASFIVQ